MALSGVLILGFIMYWLTSFSLQASQRDLLNHVAQYAGESFDALIANKQRILERIALGDPVEQYAETFRTQTLIDYFDCFQQEFPVLSFVNARGQEEIYLNKGRAIETFATMDDSRLYQTALTHPNQTHFTLPEAAADPNLAFVEFAYCRKNVFDDILGIVVGKVPITEFVENANKFEFHKVGYAAILDGNGYVIAHPNHTLIGKKLASNILDLSTPHFQGASQLSQHARAMIMGNDSYVVYRLIPRRHWIALAVLPYDTYMATQYMTRDSIIMIVLGVVVITFIISATLAKNLTQSLRQLVTATRDIANGNFSRHVAVTSQDEIGQLALSFNDMAKRLETTTTSVDKLNHEIRQRELAEKRQADLLQQIEATNAELKNFAYIVSHDLKAPLRGIKTIADWIQTDYADKLDEDGREQLGMLSQRVERMKHLIEGVLQYSRVGRDQEEIRTVHLDRILPEIIDSLAVPVHITIAIDKPLPTVRYEPTRLSQIFQNLLSNAVKYMDKPEGEIHIDVADNDNDWTFSITDNGPGIEEKYYDKIFGIFQTLNPRDEYESTGIGLAVVKKTIELAGGSIWVTSEVGKGSTFSFTIPKRGTEAMESETPSSSVSETDAERSREKTVKSI